MLGAVSTQNSSIGYCQLPGQGPATALFADSKIIVVGDASGQVHLCTVNQNGPQSLSQPTATPEQAAISALIVINDV